MEPRLLVHNLGFPRMGEKRSLKKALEEYWEGSTTERELLQTAAEIRKAHWFLQKEAGVDWVPVNDFSLYDHVLDTAAMLGVVPERFAWRGGEVDLKTYFAMARGKTGIPAMEMTKWFDTNYHYLVPEYEPGLRIQRATSKAVDEFQEAKAFGIPAKPVLLGPATFLKLMKTRSGSAFDRWNLLPDAARVYVEVLRDLKRAGAEWVQMDEPLFSLDLSYAEKEMILDAYRRIFSAVPTLNLMVANYFGDLGENLDAFLRLPVRALHIDVPHSQGELDRLLAKIDGRKTLSLGVVDGRNVWKNNYSWSLPVLRKAVDCLGADRVMVAPTCSLLHVPISLGGEEGLRPGLKGWLAFASEKLDELDDLRKVTLGDLAPMGKPGLRLEVARHGEGVERTVVRERCRSVGKDSLQRGKPYPERRKEQAAALGLPLFPTTTIGSFPQTDEVRTQRALFRRGEHSEGEYRAFLEEETERAIRWQEEVGLDVLVHGEFERTDMVEYFGENLEGFAFTKNGWVQSYGSRCVKPPIIYGDVSRPRPMTVDWASFAQAKTSHPVKGMLTGPITILQWSFVRDDQPRSETAKQIALAIRDEVADLEAAGIRVIQVDEPALREGLPLRERERSAYLRWAVDAFRLATACVKDATQVHTHMCYAEFNDIIESIAELDADVISIESSRSDMEILEAFQIFRYPNEVGPGVWDIHSPRVPAVEEMVGLARKALERVPPERLWINPDCGLKTRGWEETKAAMANLVECARTLRREYASRG